MHQAETATLVHHEGILKLTKRDAVLLTVLPVELNQGELSLIHEMGDGPAVHLQEFHGCPEAAKPMVGICLINRLHGQMRPVSPAQAAHSHGPDGSRAMVPSPAAQLAPFP